MKHSERIKVVTEAGIILLKSGGEVFRVEDTIYRMLSKFNYVSVESFVTVAGIFVSVEDESGEIFTLVRNVRDRKIDLGKVTYINDISRKFVSDEITFEEAKEKIEAAEKLGTYGEITIALGCMAACLGFTLALGGGFKDVMVSGFIGLVTQYLITHYSYKKLSSFTINIMASFGLTMAALIAIWLNIGENVDYIVGGSVTPLVPGVAIVNGVRDILDGNYLSATTRVLDASLAGIAIAIGVGISLQTWQILMGV